MVIRPKENYYKIFGEKLTLMPWGEQGAIDWFDRADDRLGGQTPRQMIEMGEGHQAEALIDELEHLHHAMLVLEEARVRFGELEQLSEVWVALDRARANLPWHR